jgi:hypothetical protein
MAAISQAMQTATEASSVTSKLSRVARFDPFKLVQKLVQKCIIQSPESSNYCFDWLDLGIESAVAFDSLPEHVSFLAGPLESVPIPSPSPPPPLSPPLPPLSPLSPITTIDNLSSRCRVHRNRLQPPRTHATHATAEEPITQSHRQYHLSPSHPSQQPTDTTNPGDTSHCCRTDYFHSQDLL